MQYKTLPVRQIICSDTIVLAALLDDGTVTEAMLKEMLLKYANDKAAQVYPDGYTLTEIEPADAFIRGDEHLNLEYQKMPQGTLHVVLYCKVERARAGSTTALTLHKPACPA